jgi:hypothetical protein
LTRFRWIRFAPLLCLLALAAGCSTTRPQPPARLSFGIYPGGPVGTVHVTDKPIPENPTLRLKAVEALRAHGPSGEPRPFVVRLYEAFTGDPQVDSWSGSGENAAADAEIASYAASGFDIDLVVRYQPMSTLGSEGVDDYIEFLRTLVQHYAATQAVHFLQIANEVNVTTSRSSSDGAYTESIHALVWGVEAASQEAAILGDSTTQVGFNWAYAQGGESDPGLWRFIRSQGLSFRKSVRWVGLDDYPGTFTDLRTQPEDTGTALVVGVRRLRELMTHYGIPKSVPIHITETGYPTGPRRSQAAQASAVSSSVRAVEQVSRSEHVSDFEWFDLRDSNSSLSNDQEQYGLMTDAYRPKSAFGVYRSLVAELGR